MARTSRALHGDSDSEMTPFSMFFLRNSLIFAKSSGEYGRGRIRIGSLSPVLIVNGGSLAGVPTGRMSLGHLRLIQFLMFSTKLETFLMIFLIFPFLSGFSDRSGAFSSASGRR